MRAPFGLGAHHQHRDDTGADRGEDRSCERAAEPLQVTVRNEQGKLWGPLALATVELLIDSGLIVGRLQVSTDGLNFAFPGRFPGIRKAFPRALWGDVIVEGDDDAIHERYDSWVVRALDGLGLLSSR